MLKGKVFLVGAGPGAADLLTVRAVAVLKKAEVLLYDRLVDEACLNHAPTEAIRIDVGKRFGDPQAERQARIHGLMAGYARRGKLVVRLKGGDPFVFGRGGEEVLALLEAGILPEVVPGVSSCIAGPSAAMIPLTLRGISSSFGVFTGHFGNQAGEGFDWYAAAHIQTAVFLMGVRRLPEITNTLIEHGRDPETPAAVVANASLPDETVVTGVLQDIAVKARNLPSPATIVVGEVAHIPGILSSARQVEDHESIFEYAL